SIKGSDVRAIRASSITVASSCCINRLKVAVACGVVPVETGGLHRGHRREDNPVPSRGNQSGRTNEVRRKELSPTTGARGSRQGRKLTSYAHSRRRPRKESAWPIASPKTRPFFRPPPRYRQPVHRAGRHACNLALT